MGINKKDFTDVDKIKNRIENNIEPFSRTNVPLVKVEKENIDPEIYEIFSRCCKV